MIDYSKLPEHMREGARAYIEQGHEPGGFLQAVFSNDFVRADQINGENLHNWASFAPRRCWGSREAINNWIEDETSHGI